MIKLNVGGGTHRLEGFLNVDLYEPTAEVKADIRDLPYSTNSVDEIRSYHSLEHVNFHEGIIAVTEWYRVLKTGGRCAIETVDFEALCKAFLAADEPGRVNLYPLIWGMEWVPGGQHKFDYTPTQLSWTMGTVGFKNIKRLPALRYIGLEDVCVYFEGYK